MTNLECENVCMQKELRDANMERNINKRTKHLFCEQLKNCHFIISYHLGFIVKMMSKVFKKYKVLIVNRSEVVHLKV